MTNFLFGAAKQVKAINDAIVKYSAALEDIKKESAALAEAVERQRERLETRERELREKIHGLEARVMVLESDRNRLQASNDSLEREVANLNRRVDQIADRFNLALAAEIAASADRPVGRGNGSMIEATPILPVKVLPPNSQS